MKQKTIIEIIIHIVFWIVTFYFFTSNSYLRYQSLNRVEEYCSVLLIAAVIYINYFFFIPKFFTKQKLIKYFSFMFMLILGISILEFLLVRDDILLFTSNVEKPIQKVMLRWNFFGILFRDSLFYAFFTMFKIYRDAIQSYKFLEEKTDTERINFMNKIEMVKSKINTHFLFNTLYNIHTMALNKSTKTPDALYNLTQLMEYVVVDSEDVMVELEKEIRFLNNYIELEKIRRESINLKFEIEGDIHPHLVPPMIFESFINNAFKYNDFPGNGLIAIKIVCKPKEINFSCENAVDKTFKATVKSTAKGIKNTVMRLNLHYNNLHLLEIDDNEKYYKVKLVLKGRF